jgi:hypothetical protein
MQQLRQIAATLLTPNLHRTRAQAVVQARSLNIKECIESASRGAPDVAFGVLHTLVVVFGTVEGPNKHLGAQHGADSQQASAKADDLRDGTSS